MYEKFTIQIHHVGHNIYIVGITPHLHLTGLCKMQEQTTHNITVAVTESGEYIAVSTGVPSFCLTGDTDDDVLKKAHEALDFYHEVKHLKHRTAPARSFLVNTVSPRRHVQLPLAAAM